MNLIDVIPNNCTGCRLCEMMCSLVHESECSTAKSRIKIFREEEFGNNLISICMQCAEPDCMESCPSQAILRELDTGRPIINSDLCSGCGICVEACSVGAISMDEIKAVAFKCDLCGGDPACVKVCSRSALAVKDIDPACSDRKLFIKETARLLLQMKKINPV